MENKFLDFKPKISIICLIYKSNEWLDFIYNQVLKHTDMWNVEFFFIANNASLEVKNYLVHNYIPHHIFESNEVQKEEWYINNVYRWYNYWVEKAKWEYVVFINSDMAFSNDWLPNLTNKYNWTNCIASRLIESGKYLSWKYWLEKNFGTEFFNYQESKFLEFTNHYKQENILKNGGLYMPLFIKKSDFLKVWWYPEWNILDWSDLYKPIIAKKWEKISYTWDEALIEKLKLHWINHTTSFDSIVYHFQAGELSYNLKNEIENKLNICIYNDIVWWTMWEKVLWNYLIEKLPWNVFWIDKRIVWKEGNLGKKVNSLIQEKYRNTGLIIQNATFIEKMDNEIPTIMYLQDDIRKMWYSTILQEDNLKKSDLIISNSLYTKESYSDYDSEVLAIWVDENIFKPQNKSELRNKYWIPNWDVWIFVWSLNEAKWWDEIKNIIISDTSISHWIIVSKYKEEFKSEKISFFSQVSQEILSELINCANFFILGSKVETQCLAAIEAALCDVPIIMRDIWIFQEFTQWEKNKLWIFWNDLEQSIFIFLKHKNFYTPREVIMNKEININKMIEKWIELISRFLIIQKSKSSLNWVTYSKPNVFYRIEIYIRRNILSIAWIENFNINNIWNANFYKKVVYNIYIKIVWK